MVFTDPVSSHIAETHWFTYLAYLQQCSDGRFRAIKQQWYLERHCILAVALHRRDSGLGISHARNYPRAMYQKTFGLHEIFKCTHLKFTVYGRKHTHNFRKCSHTSVGSSRIPHEGVVIVVYTYYNSEGIACLVWNPSSCRYQVCLLWHIPSLVCISLDEQRNINILLLCKSLDKTCMLYHNSLHAVSEYVVYML